MRPGRVLPRMASVARLLRRNGTSSISCNGRIRPTNVCQVGSGWDPWDPWDPWDVWDVWDPWAPPIGSSVAGRIRIYDDYIMNKKMQKRPWNVGKSGEDINYHSGTLW